MYVRARPYVDEVKLGECINLNINLKVKYVCNKLYFDSGSSALEWFLLEQTKKLNKQLRVAIQVFTCSSVNDAIKNADCTPIYMDIDLKYFTTRLYQLEKYKNTIDILILTHLFGIVNPDYLQIRDWCKNNNIILINDLALTVHAKVEKKTIESYGDYYIYSFAFDKPISSGFGGMLWIKEGDTEMMKNYSRLGQMSDEESSLKMKLFYLYYLLTDSNIYIKEFRRNSFIEKLIIKYFNIERLNKNFVYGLLSSRINHIFAKLTRIFLFKQNKRKILKMNKYHYSYLMVVEENIDAILSNYEVSYNTMKDEILGDYKIENIGVLHSTYGQRTTVLLENREYLIDNLKERGIEAGYHNWPKLICSDKDIHSFPNADKVIRSFINLPIWSTSIWKN